MTKTGFSLADIEAQVASSEADKFEPFLPNGDPSGIVLHVLSDQSPKVVAALQELRDARKRKEQLIASQAARSRPGEALITAEEDDNYTRQLVAVRLAGWDGLDDPFTPEAAIRLLKVAPTFIPQVLARAEKLASFTKPSPKTS